MTGRESGESSTLISLTRVVTTVARADWVMDKRC